MTARRRALRLIALGSLGALALALACRLRYPALSQGLWRQARYTSLAESRNLWSYLGYHVATLEQLRLNRATGAYDFRATPEAGLSRLELGRLAFHRGDFPRAIALLKAAIDHDGESAESLFWLALATMRQAEAKNCLAALEHAHGTHQGGHGGLCTLPLRRLHDHPENSRRAMAIWERYLEREDTTPSDRRLARWLLNFSAMTIGAWPAHVPARHRIETPFTDAFYGRSAEATRRANADLRFVDRAVEFGVENPGNGRGTAVEDFDGDGDLDLVSTGYFGGVSLFLSEGPGRFRDATAESGLAGLRQPLGITPGDVDGDGDLDLFVTLPFSRYHLMENLGGGRFRDVTERSGLLAAIPDGALAVSWMSSFGDVDRDGDLDLIVASWAFRVPLLRNLAARERIDTKLFTNDHGRFTDATAAWGLDEIVADQHFIGATFGDYDADGWLDLFLAAPLPSTSVLLHNEAVGTARRFVRSDRFDDPSPGFTAAFVDVDHDGRLDLFRGGAGDARSTVEQAVFGDRSGRFKSGHSTILRQGADGRFTPRDDFFGDGSLAISTMGASWGDLDNDGCLDFYLGTGSPEPWNVMPNLMFRGERTRNGAGCSGKMTNVSMIGGFGNVQKGHGIVFWDVDDDGDQDVYSSLGGMWPADRWSSQLFVNEGENENAWVKVRLRGRTSNGFGLGSQLTVRAHTADGRKIVRTAQIDNRTNFGSPPYLAHVGLLDAVAIDEIEVAWLGSGCVGAYPAALRTLNQLDEADCLARPRGGRSPQH